METGAGHDVHVMEVNPLDDLSKSGRQTHDGVLTLFHSIGHGILANTGTDRPQSLGRAGKYKINSCSVPKPEVHAGNQSCECVVETQLVRRWWALYLVRNSCTLAVCLFQSCFFFMCSQCTKLVLRQEKFLALVKAMVSP